MPGFWQERGKVATSISPMTVPYNDTFFEVQGSRKLSELCWTFWPMMLELFVRHFLCQTLTRGVTRALPLLRGCAQINSMEKINSTLFKNSDGTTRLTMGS